MDSVEMEVRIRRVKQGGQYWWLQGRPETAVVEGMSSKQLVHSAVSGGAGWVVVRVLGLRWAGRSLKSLWDFVVRSFVCCRRAPKCFISDGMAGVVESEDWLLWDPKLCCEVCECEDLVNGRIERRERRAAGSAPISSPMLSGA